MEINYGDIIKNIFERKRQNNQSNENNINIPFIATQDNTNESISKIEKNNNNLNQIPKEDNSKRILTEINLDSNISKFNKKNQNTCKEKILHKKNKNYSLNLDNQKLNNFKQLNEETKNNNKKKIEALKELYEDNFKFNFEPNMIKSYDKNNITTPASSREKKKKKSPKKKEKDYFFKKFEKYNTENLFYQAMKNYSQCKPANKNFLDRMNFYSIKNQTKNDIVNLIVKKTTPKIREIDRINIFNHLIEDANRRVEAKNRVILVNQNQKINNALYEKKKKKKKKFDEEKFLSKYNEEVIHKLNQRERNLDLLRKQKIEEEKKKEEKLLKEMEKRRVKVSKKKIEEISNRMYNEAVASLVKKEMIKSKSYNENFISNRNEKFNYEKNFNNKINDNDNDNIKKNNIFFSDRINLNYNPDKDFRENKNYHKNQKKKNKSVNNSFKHTHNQSFGMTKEKYSNFQNAEKIIDDFFKQHN